jgi:hypothetical protein
LIEVDLAAGSGRPVAVEGNPQVRAFALSKDARSIVAALAAKALMRIVRIPLFEVLIESSLKWHLVPTLGRSVTTRSRMSRCSG